jgi:hypothetical protein
MQNKFNKSVIAFIQKIAEQGFKTQTYYDTFRTELKVHNICTKLRVNSIEEVIRQVLFYGWFELNITEDYKDYVLKRARDYITTAQVVRNQMLEFAKNVPQTFGELCTHSACLNDEELKDRADLFINAVKSDKESYRLFSSVRSFTDLIGNKYNFKMIFDNIFHVDDDSMEDVNKAEQVLQSSSAKYLMIVRMCIEKAFPIKLKRELTIDENNLLNFLLYKGDEIDYMEQYSVSTKDFMEKLNSLYDVYGVFDTQELLISVSVQKSFSESSLVYESFFYNIRAKLLINNKDEYLTKVSNDKQKELSSYFTELEEYSINDFFTALSMKKLESVTNKLCDCDYTTIGKIEEFSNWYYNNIQSKNNIKMLINILRQIDNIIQF